MIFFQQKEAAQTSSNKNDNMKKIVLAGNPNVGKSTIFNALTGLNQHTGNWTGKTVEFAAGKYTYKNVIYKIFDVPGTYSLAANSPEEFIACDLICSEDIDLTIIILDATCLERNLILAFQIMAMTENVLLCVNLMDEAERNGINVDVEEIEKLLKVPVVGISANNRKDIRILKEAVDANFNKVCSCGHKLLFEKGTTEELIYLAEEIGSKTVCFKNSETGGITRDIDKIITSKMFGIPIMIVFLGSILWITVCGANYPSQLLFRFFEFLEPYAAIGIKFLHMPDRINNMLMDGVYRTVAWVTSVMLPPIGRYKKHL